MKSTKATNLYRKSRLTQWRYLRFPAVTGEVL
jgi:hypothetical protein